MLANVPCSVSPSCSVSSPIKREGRGGKGEKEKRTEGRRKKRRKRRRRKKGSGRRGGGRKQEREEEEEDKREKRRRRKERRRAKRGGEGNTHMTRHGCWLEAEPAGCYSPFHSPPSRLYVVTTQQGGNGDKEQAI